MTTAWKPMSVIYRLMLTLMLTLGLLLMNAQRAVRASQWLSPSLVNNSSPRESLLALREGVVSAFQHAIGSYMKHGFPHDEVMPISCQPRKHTERVRGTLDDVLGGYMLTLVDSLDSMILLGQHELFQESLNKLVQHNMSFDRDIEVSVFEVNIRVLGGLLSAHQLAAHLYDHSIYDGHRLLDYAIDIGNRLLPAFSTRTGVPMHRINLQRGQIANETRLTCTAAGSSFLVEMALLSRLSENPVYENVALKAIRGIWSRRSSLDLVGALFDTHNGKWIQEHTGTGAGIDSFYETLLKSSILLGDDLLLEWFNTAYQAVEKNVFAKNIQLHVEVNMQRGIEQLHSPVISSLQAFWPALQVLYGRVDEAVVTFASLEKIWDTFGALPDMYDFTSKSLFPVYGRDYPLRPEMVESAYYLYLATRNPVYLEFGRKVLTLLETKCRVSCGYASISDLTDLSRLDDRMDSYFLAETLKYLYLLFDEGLDPADRRSMFCHAVPDTDLDGSELKEDDQHQRQQQRRLEDRRGLNSSGGVTDPAIDNVNDDSNHDVTAGLLDKNSIHSLLSARPSAAPIKLADLMSSDSMIEGDIDMPLSHPSSPTATVTATVSSNEIILESTSNEAKNKRLVRSARRCISQHSSLFSTEGHLFILDKSLRDSNRRSATSSSSSSMETTNDGSAFVDICPLPLS